MTKSILELQKESDSRVFKTHSETSQNLYGARNEYYNIYEKNISHWGFEDLSDFDIAIKEVKGKIENYNQLLKNNQKQLLCIIKKVQLYKKYPEVALRGEVIALKNKYDALIKNKKSLENSQISEEKHLKELSDARKRLLNNKKNGLFNNKLNERKKINEEYNIALRELRERAYKMYKGLGDDFDRERFNVLRKEILPELLERLRLVNEDEKIEQSSVVPIQEEVQEKEETDAIKELTHEDENIVAKNDVLASFNVSPSKKVRSL